MRRLLLKNLFPLVFALAGLGLITGNLLIAVPPPAQVRPEGSCDDKAGYMAQCWIFCPSTWSNTGQGCVFTGNAFHFCHF